MQFSDKQVQVLTWWKTPQYDAVICDGAVRSGKTMAMSLSFVLWAMSQFNGQSFGLCAKTISALRRNLLVPLVTQLKPFGMHWEEKTSVNFIDIRVGNRSNRFYLFGGRDESSASLIQGMTLAGILLDEVALMPRSFVEQALARCSVPGSRFWFNCNPEHPRHWFYTEWIQKARQKRVLYLHFTMADNPSLTPSILRRYESLYSGTFYERFVQGRWVNTTGLVYPQFREDSMTYSTHPPFTRYCVSCDYGTVNPTSMGLWGLSTNGVWHRIREYYYDARREGAQQTDEEYYQALCTLAGDLPVDCIVIDPSAASFQTCIRRHGKFPVLPARNEVLSGIRLVSEALREGKLCFHESCTDLFREFGLYRWQERGQDAPIKQHDHAMDDLRYFVSTILSDGNDDFFVCSTDRGAPVIQNYF